MFLPNSATHVPVSAYVCHRSDRPTRGYRKENSRGQLAWIKVLLVSEILNLSLIKLKNTA